MKFSKYFDHTNLKPNALKQDIDKLIDEAVSLDVRSVCINPCWVKYAKNKLKDTDVYVCTVIGFPLGANSTETKVYEAKMAIKDGADEVDMVINIGKLLDEEYDYVAKEIRDIKNELGERTLKCIIETCLLDDDKISIASKLVEKSGGDFVKTSTGFNGEGATIHAIDIIKNSVSGECGIKAAGGIGDKNTAQLMISHGATRIGASKSNAILNTK